ncbi:hypothetical protein AXK60_11810 [Tsukamurella pseudospumae]|uniref:Uncharacterized protein n=1 Tax=Tsukamurella pseudospumae TaxID=239498 RepID=A0A138A8L1_9ACTN|nr:hypothetical protein AXK60_11810 [Tsukamurella pseudospumae]
MHVTTDPPSWIAQYAPLVTGIAAFVAALLALAGVWWNNRSALARQRSDLEAAGKRQRADLDAARKRQQGDIAAAEERRQRDVAAAEARERERHRRELMAQHVGDLVATVTGALPLATKLRGFLRRLKITTATTIDQNLERSRELDGYRDALRAQLDKAKSLDYQIRMLAPPTELATAVEQVTAAGERLSKAAETSPESDDSFLSEFVRARDAVTKHADDVVTAYRAAFPPDITP